MDTTLESRPAWRPILRPLVTTRGWTALTHHLTGLPLGVAYFTWLVTGLSLGLGLAITLIGIPLLTLVFASVRPLLEVERRLSNALLGTELRRVGLTPGGEGWVARLKAYWTDLSTWRGIAYLLARFPVGVVTFSVAVAAYSAALYLIASPIVAPFGGTELGVWQPDTWLEGFALVPAGLVALVAAGWISEGMAVLSRGLARWGAR